MRKRILPFAIAAGTVATVVGFLLLTPVSKVAATSCSNSTISGTYGGYFWGSQNGTLSNSVTVVSFNGSGSFSLSYWGMIGGSSTSGSQSGSYSVNSNCEGTMYNPSNGSIYNTFSIVSSGSEVDFVNNASGANISGVAKKQ